MNLKEGSYCVFQKVFFPPQNRHKNISTADILLLREFLACLTEDCPDMFSDRFLWLWAGLQWK